MLPHPLVPPDGVPALFLLGSVSLRHPERGALRQVLAQPKRLALLAYVAVAGRSGGVPRDVLLATFWSEADADRARSSLRSAMHFLRKALGDASFGGPGLDTVAIAPGAVWCDALAFEDALDAGRAAEALRLYRGDFLTGLHVADAPAWERWVDDERARLGRLATTAAWSLAERAAQADDWDTAGEWVRRALALAPDDEALLRRSMTLLARTGDPSGALRAHESFAAHLARDLELPPSAATRTVADTIRAAVARDGVPAAPQRPVARTLPCAPEAVPPDSAGTSSPPEGGSPTAEAAPGGAPSATPDVSPAPPADGSSNLAPTPAPAGPRRRRRIIALVAGAAVGLFVTAAVRLVAARPPTDPGRVLVLPFAVRGGAEWAYLSEGMVDLLDAKLEGAGELHLVDVRALATPLDLARAASDPNHARSLARRLGASSVVMGTVVSEGPTLLLSAALYRVGDRPELVARAVGEAPPDGLPALVDSVAAQLLVGPRRGAAGRLDRVAVTTTSSLPALKAYLLGRHALRQGAFALAREHFARSVALDSTFALAAYHQSVAEEFAGVRGPEPHAPIQLAMRHAARLGPHERRLVEARAAIAAGDAALAEARYQAVVAEYPDDADAWYQLGDLLFHDSPGRGRPQSVARPAFERVVALAPDHVHALVHLARIAAADGRSPAVDSLTRRVLAQQPAGDEALEMRALRAVALKDEDALATTVAAFRHTPDQRAWIAAWRAAVHGTAPDRAWPLFAALAAAPRPTPTRAAAHLALANLAVAAGRPRQAYAELAAADALVPECALFTRVQLALVPRVPYAPSQLAALLAQVRRAEATGADRRPVTRVSQRLLLRERMPSGYLTALVLARLGDAGGALAWQPGESQEADSLAHSPGGFRSDVAAAVALFAPGARRLLPEVRMPDQGALPRAHRWTAEATVLGREGQADAAAARDGAMVHDLDYDIAYAAPAALHAAELLDAAGRRADAARAYRRFAALWANAEPAARPLVARAEARGRAGAGGARRPLGDR